MKRPSFWKRAAQFPPCLVRLMAKHRYGGPLSTMDIVERGMGLTIHQVETIGWSTDWSCCSVVEMRRFLSACSCDWENKQQLDRMMAYIRKRCTWKYLRVHPQWGTFYEPLLEKYRQSILKRK